MTYRHRRPEGTIEAVQWTGDNQEEIAAFCEKHAFENECLWIPGGDHYRHPIFVGWYIIHGNHGGVTSMSPEHFEARYEADA